MSSSRLSGKTRRGFYSLLIPIGFVILALSILFAGVLPNTAVKGAGVSLPTGSTIIPLGADQSRGRHAYQGIFETVYSSAGEVAWTAAQSSYNGDFYAPGMAIGINGLSGDFDSYSTDGSYTVDRSHILHPRKIAVFYSTVRDASNQVVTWEEATFETIFRVYLWGDYFDTIDEMQIKAGDLADYDILILPSITIGYADEVAQALGDTGLEAIKAWVQAGGSLYAQGDGCFLVEAAGLVPDGTVDEGVRLTDSAPYDNLAEIEATASETDRAGGLAFSAINNSTYILDDPLLHATEGITVAAAYVGTSQPGTPAILYAESGEGEVMLTNAHPSVQQNTYPLVFDALFTAMSERAGLSGNVKQEFSAAVAEDVIPAYEAGVPVRVTNRLLDYWDEDLEEVTITETVKPGFVVQLGDISPAPASLTTNAGGTRIVWYFAGAAPGTTTMEYVARTLTDTLASGEAVVSTAQAIYTDPLSGLRRTIQRASLSVHSKMAARLNGDRDIELDGLYPLPAEGAYFDIALTLENKEETDAQDIVITDVVALISPIVDVDDQRVIPTVLTDTETMTSTSETLWVRNEVFFYNNANYPLPAGATSASDVFNLANWDGTTFYTYTNELSNAVTIPITYSGFITVTHSGAIRLPAVMLTWDYGDLQGYDYQDPAVRYGVFSRELMDRQVSFASDPMLVSGVVLNGGGGTVFTNLGGHPIPYHEYLSSGVVTIPEGPTRPRVTYKDIWTRPHEIEMRTVSYDIVPFPPPEYHAVVNTTFDIKTDWDGDGQMTDSVLEYPSRAPAALHLMLKSHSNFDPLLTPLQKDETLISQGLFKGLGFTLEPANETWENSWSFRDLQGRGPDATALADVIDTPAYTYLYFQQELESQKSEVIDINGVIDASGGHREGVMKINDGARFVYHQKAVGPSRYEVFDSHVQAVLGLRSDAEVSKQVAPVRIATYADNVYHFIKVEDPWDPRQFAEDPYIQSYGFGDTAATVFVGGRHQRNLLFSRVNPGDATQVRLEINNNTGVTMTNVTITPQAPAGVHVTLRSYTDTTAIEPLFFDFPFLNAIDIPDAWKGVYYFDVTVDNPFPGERGKVYKVEFAVSGENIPAEFSVPPAMLGIKDSSGKVQTTFGPATELELTDRMPSWVTLRDARIANQTEMQALVDAINYDDAHTGSQTALTLYNTLRTGIVTQTVATANGTQVTFTLPPYAERWPWVDNGKETGVLYVIAYSDIAVNWSGTALADEAPAVTYTDYFDQPQTAVGNSETVEAHGAVLTTTYEIVEVNDEAASILGGLVAGQPNTVTVQATLTNIGDDISADTLVTYTIPAGVTLAGALPEPDEIGETMVSWQLGDLGPGARRRLEFTFLVNPGPLGFGAAAALNKPAAQTAPAAGELRLISGGDGKFLNIYAQQIVRAPVSSPLDIKVAGIVVYFNDFENGVGNEWSVTTHGRTPDGRGFLGEVGNQTVTLNLSTLPAHRGIYMTFDLFIIRSWDGSQVNYPASLKSRLPLSVDGVVGPDVWNASVDGQQLFQTTFSNWDSFGFRQAYPGSYPGGSYVARTGASENNTLGYYYSFTDSTMDSVYHLSLTGGHNQGAIRIDLAALGLQELEDESWGIDNFRLSVLNPMLPSGPPVFMPLIFN